MYVRKAGGENIFLNLGCDNSVLRCVRGRPNVDRAQGSRIGSFCPESIKVDCMTAYI